MKKATATRQSSGNNIYTVVENCVFYLIIYPIMKLIASPSENIIWFESFVDNEFKNQWYILILNLITEKYREVIVKDELFSEQSNLCQLFGIHRQSQESSVRAFTKWCIIHPLSTSVKYSVSFWIYKNSIGIPSSASSLKSMETETFCLRMISCTLSSFFESVANVDNFLNKCFVYYKNMAKFSSEILCSYPDCANQRQLALILLQGVMKHIIEIQEHLDQQTSVNDFRLISNQLKIYSDTIILFSQIHSIKL